MAARIASVTIPSNKRVVISLTYIKGVGRSTAEKVLDQLNIDHNTRVKDLTEEQVKSIRNLIEGDYKVEGNLLRDILLHIKRLREIHSYRGLRHSKKLPVRGQRSKTNSRTVRGNKRNTMGSGKIKATKK